MKSGWTKCAADPTGGQDFAAGEAQPIAGGLERQIRYDLWANRESLVALKGACTPIEDAVRIAGHIVGISERWLARVEGSTADVGAWPDFPLEEIAARQEELAARWLAQVREAADHRMVVYHDSRGRETANTLGELVQEVLLHAAHHRGQIALLLRMHGHEPAASTDFIPALRTGQF